KRADAQAAFDGSASTLSIHRLVAPIRLDGKTALSDDTENSRAPPLAALRARSSTAKTFVSIIRIKLNGSRSERTCLRAAKLNMTWNGPATCRKRSNPGVPNMATEVTKSCDNR